MANDLYRPRADAVDGELFIETRTTATATAALWTLLGLSRQDPRPWIPTTILCGESGSGRTMVAQRFVNATQRNAACDLLRERVPGADPEQDKRDVGHLARATGWAEQLVQEYGRCPGICHPAAWVPQHLIAQVVHESQAVHPAVRIKMEPRPDRDGLALGNHVWRSRGNVSHHPTRRTTIMLLDDADRLLSVPESRRRDVLDRIHDWDQKIGHRVAVVLIGSPALAAAVAESRTVQVIRLEAMDNDEEFATVAAMVCGASDPQEVASLHKSSSGLMGRLCHIARLQGLTPPYQVRPDEIARLPAPARQD